MNSRIKKIVCLGDSFTVGYMVDPDHVWTSILKSRLPRCKFVIRGINGDTTSGMLARLGRDVIEERPHNALIIGGANDIISMCGSSYPGGRSGSGGGSFDPTAIIRNNMMAMIHQLYDNRIIPIIATHVPCIREMVPPVWSRYYDFSDFNEIVAGLNRWREDFGESFQCASLDLFSPVLKIIKSDREYARTLYIDGIHLSADGHNFIAEEMLSQLEDII